MSDNIKDTTSDTPEVDKSTLDHIEESKLKTSTEYKDPVTVGDEKPDSETLEQSYLSLLNVDLSELDKLTEKYAQGDTTSSGSARAWVSAYLSGLSHLMKGSSFSESVERANSDWVQTVESEGNKLNVCKAKFGSSTGEEISGSRAVLKVTESLGLGSTVCIPLWHTGIWVTIKCPSESSLLELDRLMATEKITLGRYTSGMVFSNTSVYTVSYVVNFIMDNIIDATVKNISKESLKKLIKVTDIPTLIGGIATAIYPKGYNYSRPCTTNPSECQHVVTGTVSIPKLFWTDNNALSDFQKRHMTDRDTKHSLEDLKRYYKEHSRGNYRRIELSEDISMEVLVPTISEYEKSGFTWVSNIVKLLEGSLQTELDGSEREKYVISQGKISTMRQYGHWVNKIIVGDDVILDRETIDNVITTLSSSDELSDVYFTEIGKYIDSSMISLLAIPKYKCPSCHTPQESDLDNEHFKHLLPIDAVRTFFTFLDQHIYKALIHKSKNF